jgi:hypothetical protein
MDEARIARHFTLIGRDNAAASEIYTEDAVLEYVQSRELIRGRADITASRDAYPGRPTSFEVHRCVGNDGNVAVELTMHIEGDEPHPAVAVLDLRDGLVARERIYICEPWDPPAYRARWVTG